MQRRASRHGRYKLHGGERMSADRLQDILRYIARRVTAGGIVVLAYLMVIR